MSNARNLANLLSPGASTLASAAIADDAITAAKIDDDGTGFTVGDLTVGGTLTSSGDIIGNNVNRMLLDASASGTDVGENFLLDASASGTDVGGSILFEVGTGGAGEFVQTGTVLQVVRKQNRIAIARTGSGKQQVMTAEITPRSVHSKIMIFSRLSGDIHGGGSSGILNVVVFRGPLTDDVFAGDAQNQYYEGPASGSSVNNYQSATNMIIDTPHTTSEVTYALCFARGSGGTVEVNTIGSTHPTEMVLMEIG